MNISHISYCNLIALVHCHDKGAVCQEPCWVLEPFPVLYPQQGVIFAPQSNCAGLENDIRKGGAQGTATTW